MNESGRMTFGEILPGIEYLQRVAAYAVILRGDRRVAAVRSHATRRAQLWLPGGGGHPGETAEATVRREVREELGSLIEVTGRIGEAIQYFHAAEDKCWYEMTATFFRAELEVDPLGPGEHELLWVDGREPTSLFFHACHAWAVGQALGRPGR